MIQSFGRVGALVAVAIAAMFAFGAAPSGASSGTPPDPTRLDRVWAAPAPEEPETIAGDPDGVVVVGRDADVLALDTRGAVQWHASLGHVTVTGQVGLGDGLVVVPVDRSRVVALDRASGARRWEHTADAVLTSASAADVVATISLSGRVELLDAATGTTQWTISPVLVGDLLRARVWILANRVVAAWTDDAGSHLRAFEQTTGSTAWRDDARHFASMPAVSGGASVVFAANDRDDHGEVVAHVRSLGVIDGAQRWSRELRGTSPYWTAVETAAGRGVIAVVDLDGRVTMLDARTGTVRWRRTTLRRQFEASPQIAGGVFVLTTYGTGLTAFGVTRGSTVDNDEPGVGQTLVTIEASATAANRLYLLVRYGRGDGGVWMLRAGRG